MPRQAVDRIIRGAHVLHIGLADDASHGQVRIVLQHVGSLVPDLLRVVLGQRLGDAEVFVELKVGPVVHRVSDGHLQGSREAQELLIGIRASGDLVLRNTVGTHDSPLVVVAEVAAVVIPAAQPDLRDVVVAAVLIDLLRRNVAVIVDDRHFFRVIVEEMLCRLVVKHKVLVHKCFHVLFSFFGASFAFRNGS